jgi:hypothetical protein
MIGSQTARFLISYLGVNMDVETQKRLELQVSQWKDSYFHISRERENLIKELDKYKLRAEALEALLLKLGSDLARK